MNELIYALFHYEDGVVGKVTYPRQPKGLSRMVKSKLARPIKVTFSIEQFPNQSAAIKELSAWIEECNLALTIKSAEIG